MQNLLKVWLENAIEYLFVFFFAKLGERLRTDVGFAVSARMR